MTFYFHKIINLDYFAYLRLQLLQCLLLTLNYFSKLNLIKILLKNQYIYNKKNNKKNLLMGMG